MAAWYRETAVILTGPEQKPNQLLAQLGYLEVQSDGARLPRQVVKIIADELRHRRHNLGALELPPERARGAEQAHERPARIRHNNAACTHRLLDVQHEVAASRGVG